jgi:hypothetical protein
MQTAIELDNAALGLALPEDRTPVAMPTALPPASVTEPPPDAPASPTPEEGQDTVQGVIDKVQTKKGTNKRGDFTRYGISVDGTNYGTFDTKLGELAESLKGKEVILTVEQNGKYWNALEIEPVERKTKQKTKEDPKQQTDEDTEEPPMREPGADEDQDDLPFNE